mmetsp:Transcript_120218/g.347422  ORF Transcript_120218/g.347422 Transcript_120218/m.347422 type:complete len:436 (-) Transcript_120218:78-1385(-)
MLYLHEVAHRRRRRLQQFVIDGTLIAAAVAIILWVLLGAVVYYLVGTCSEVPRRTADGRIVDNYLLCPWGFAHSFYYSVQTGLSIGFGLLSENQAVSKAYSCFHILAGSSFIGGALSLFISLMLNKQQSFLSSAEQRLLKACLALHTDGAHDLTMPQVRDMMLMHPQYARELIRATYPDPKEVQDLIDKFENGSPPERLILAATVLSAAKKRLSSFRNGVQMADIMELDKTEASFSRKLSRAIRAKANFLRMSAAFIVWVSVGAVFSHICDGNDIITSVYFAISALSTAGIIATTTVESGAHVIFVSFFCLVGVPLYAAMLGSYANLLVEGHIERQVKLRLDARLSQAEVTFLQHIKNTDDNDEVTLSEYTELQLLRLGVVDRGTLQQIRNRFKALDKDGAGKLRLADFLHRHDLPDENTDSSEGGQPEVKCGSV